MTLGTGIGIGLVINGALVHGLVHPEGGHMRLTKHEKDKEFTGVCEFHHDCLEGLAASGSVLKRKALTDIDQVSSVRFRQ
jgi:fructokinase